MKLHIKHMVSIRCKLLAKSELDKLGITYTVVDLGEAEVKEHITDEQRKRLNDALLKSGLELMNDKKQCSLKKLSTSL